MEDSLLPPLQAVVLRGFFAIGAAEHGYYLTGGTALSEYYLRHRVSDDLDLFTSTRDSIQPGLAMLAQVADGHALTFSVDRAETTFVQAAIGSPQSAQPPLVVHVAHDSSPRIEAAHDRDGVMVDSLVDIAVQKLETVYGRTEVKDFVDLYLILQEGGFTIDALLSLVPRKQVRFDIGMFAACLTNVERFTFLPRMIKPVGLADLQDYFMSLARELANRYRPPDRRER